MYSVSLIHLAPDGRSTQPDVSRIDRGTLRDDEMRALLENFCAVDPLENAAADPEIRVQTNDQSWLIRAGQRKLILYDVLNRETPGQQLAVGEVMAELDGSATATRARARRQMAMEAPPQEPASVTAAMATAARKHLRRRLVLGACAAVLLAGLTCQRHYSGKSVPHEDVMSLPAKEAAEMQRAFAGVYVTGTQPGQHGLVMTAAGELRLFEFRAVEAPRVVNATAKWGRSGSGVGLITDQPGGLIAIVDRDTLVYCGETYRRVP